MDDTAKYLIHADITADGVVERSDVVGAIFGQTEGLLGDDLDLRDLQQSSKVGRIDVHVESQHGQSFGTITIASSLDKVETAILAASLETIERVGPCRASVSIASIEDVRAAKRREVVDRAKDLLSSSFDDSVMTSQEILDEVRQSIRVEDITEYEGFPAGPNVVDSDAIIVVEGRSDVLTLLRYGVKNAIAVEGTNVPDTVADLTQARTTTAFLDADRGGDLILKELDQVGDIDYVAVAPTGKSVEDLSRDEVMASLRGKRRFDRFDADDTVMAATDGSTLPAPEIDESSTVRPLKSSTETNASEADTTSTSEPSTEETDTIVEPTESAETDEDAETDGTAETPDGSETGETADSETVDSEMADSEATDSAAADEPTTLRSHVGAVIDDGTATVRLLDDDFGILAEAPADETFAAIEGSETVPHAVVFDGTLSQRVLDVAAQRGVEQIVSRDEGEFVKKPTTVRIITADQFHEE
ncbi:MULTISPECIES: DNA primase DnaG [unclassified Haladaptatus]|uniref:DNA primase DnaG n=1 Tax=unclassified Haladaptatus TaxID=2622732 RepID=UPI00209BBB1C|nr:MULTISPECIES: DNA primase DnaG [unclassified Haladaptatus]MCO8242910.1 DNA primase DnaG [Haladaptatus sp. AB643]MCO8252667.1 DNA primase DnaG [Haladaptatus sp. AB618]